MKLVVIFPYAFVDTSEAWFEPRRRRIAISAAGPISDFSLGGIFSICCVFVEGTVRDVFFQLAFAGYVGAFFNLNPWIDRDGYHMLVDYLREPGLRQAREGPVQPPPEGRGTQHRLARAGPLLDCRARLVDTGCRLRDLHVTAL